MLKKKKNDSSKFTVNFWKEKGILLFKNMGGTFLYLSEVDKQNINNEEKEK